MYVYFFNSSFSPYSVESREFWDVCNHLACGQGMAECKLFLHLQGTSPYEQRVAPHALPREPTDWHGV